MAGITRTCWKKGQSGNPNGRPKNPETVLLREAMKRAKEDRGVDLLDHFVDRAYENDSVLIAVFKKLMPDLKNVEGSTEFRQKVINLVGVEPLEGRRKKQVLSTSGN